MNEFEKWLTAQGINPDELRASEYRRHYQRYIQEIGAAAAAGQVLRRIVRDRRTIRYMRNRIAVGLALLTGFLAGLVVGVAIVLPVLLKCK